jgi:hypothetical protein
MPHPVREKLGNPCSILRQRALRFSCQWCACRVPFRLNAFKDFHRLVFSMRGAYQMKFNVFGMARLCGPQHKSPQFVFPSGSVLPSNSCFYLYQNMGRVKIAQFHSGSVDRSFS